MTKSEIQILLKKKYSNFVQYIDTFSEENFSKGKDEKWSPRQNAVHLFRAVEPLLLAYQLPKFLLTILFGKSNRPSRTYEALVEKYHTKLKAGGRASGRFIPPKDSAHKKEIHLQKINACVKKLESIILKRWSEKDLDLYIFPHPLLGKITAREMLFFTAYHAQHHEETMKKIYTN